MDPATRSLDNALSLQQKGQYAEAESGFKALLQSHPDDMQVALRYADFLNETRQFNKAERTLRTWSLSHGSTPDIQATLAFALHKQGKMAEAQKHYVSILQKHPQHVAAMRNHAIFLNDNGRPAKAVDALRDALSLDPDDALALNALAVALSTLGDLQEAKQAALKATRVRPHYEPPHANLLTILNGLGELDEALAHIEAIKSLIKEPLLCTVMEARILRRKGRHAEAIALLESGKYADMPMTAVQAQYELGLLYDKIGEHKKAFAQFERFNALATEAFQITPELKREYLGTLASYQKIFTQDWIKSWQPVSVTPAQKTVFLFGFPRSGTTLLQHILNAHPDIYASEEIPAFPAMIKTLEEADKTYPASLAKITRKQVEKIQDGFFHFHQQARLWEPAKILIDKYPLGTLYAGVIHRIFPDAPQIFMTRHPCDCILSCYMQMLQPNRGTVHMYDLKDIVDLYCRLMDLWLTYKKVLPLRALHVRYEDIIENFDETIRGVLSFIDLEWVDSLRDYDQKVRAESSVRTPSYEQVSQKPYTHAKYRWEKYREHFEPYLGRLAHYMKEFGYTA